MEYLVQRYLHVEEEEEEEEVEEGTEMEEEVEEVEKDVESSWSKRPNIIPIAT